MDLVDFIEKSCDKTLLSWQKKLIRLIDDLQVKSIIVVSPSKGIIFLDKEGNQITFDNNNIN